jgi:hypothetical protein
MSPMDEKRIKSKRIVKAKLKISLTQFQSTNFETKALYYQVLNNQGPYDKFPRYIQMLL